jgi:hypothetical protein
VVFFRRFLNLFRRSDLQREIEDELQSHIELQIEANLAEGMSPGGSPQACSSALWQSREHQRTRRDRRCRICR